jgi:26S proteasome regulatory subunit N9
VGPANEFYSAALMFLSYTSVEALRPEERYTLATDMALASVTGDDIYNFGEVLATPILSALKGTANEWLLSLVEAMNSGNVEQFNHAVEAHRAQYFAQPALASKHDSVVKQKIVLLCLVNIAFERHSHDRVINFSDIAQRAHIPFEQVPFSPLICFCIILNVTVYDSVFWELGCSLSRTAKFSFHSVKFDSYPWMFYILFPLARRWSGC